MLTPNTVPSAEPEIRVGIVLPEDQETRIEVHIPEGIAYELRSLEGVSKALPKGAQLVFEMQDAMTRALCNDEFVDVSGTWQVQPSIDYEITARCGALVRGVISGRSFHWRKHIDVYLPGILEIGILEGQLTLINELPIEEYLMCVATSEMGAECPAALIESQTIVARSWMLANVEMKHRSLGMDVCNDDCCQRYQGTTHLSRQSIEGARNTFGQVLLYDQRICDARYSKSCGGVMETFENVWSGPALPYMQPLPDAAQDFQHAALPLDTEEKVRQWIEDLPRTFCSSKMIPEDELQKYLGSVDEKGTYFRWQFRYSQAELTALLNRKCQLEASAILDVEPVRRGHSGRLIELNVHYLDAKGAAKTERITDQYRIREVFHESFLYSSAFVVDKIGPEQNSPEAFVLKGAGWGHGAGYCQIGAVGMALSGYTTEQIVLHYFPGSQLKKIY